MRDGNMHSLILKPFECRLIESLLPVILPSLPVQEQRFRRRVMYHIDRFLIKMPLLFRWLFHLGAWLFDVSPILFLSRPQRFHRSPLTFRQYWTDRTYRTSVMPLYRWFHIIRGLILLVYYSQDEQHRRMRYYPADWVKFNVMKRRRKLNLVEEAPHDSQPSRFQPRSS